MCLLSKENAIAGYNMVCFCMVSMVRFLFMVLILIFNLAPNDQDDLDDQDDPGDLNDWDVAKINARTIRMAGKTWMTSSNRMTVFSNARRCAGDGRAGRFSS